VVDAPPTGPAWISSVRLACTRRRPGIRISRPAQPAARIGSIRSVRLGRHPRKCSARRGRRRIFNCDPRLSPAGSVDRVVGVQPRLRDGEALPQGGTGAVCAGRPDLAEEQYASTAKRMRCSRFGDRLKETEGPQRTIAGRWFQIPARLAGSGPLNRSQKIFVTSIIPTAK
jgi:hypothetical protein